MMAKAMGDEGIELVHVIGARAGHQYTRDAKIEINRRIDSIADAGRDPVPRKVCFTTWTLRYNRSFWVQIDGLQRHWERARIEADLLGSHGESPEIKTKNISALTLTFPPGRSPLPPSIGTQAVIVIDQQGVETPRPLSDRSWIAHYRKLDGKWGLAATDEDGKIRKRHGLQGPIDDAFMDSFLMIAPSSPPLHNKTGKWAATEMRHAIDHWRRQFRGEARVKDDKDVNDGDIAVHNLILWGDPSSNVILAKIIDRLPLVWNKETVRFGDEQFDAGHHMPVLIYPNPLNPKQYVVLNSGFTFREYDYLNNARQVPKLPDYAVVDIDVPASSRAPGSIVTANFFTEDWSVPRGR